MVSAITCFALNILTEFNSIVISFVVFLSCCSCANLVMAVAVNLFPTSYRGMATAFILMFGRLGGFVGSNLVGLLLSSMCSLIFYINGGLLISKLIFSEYQVINIPAINQFYSILGCVVLFLFMKTNSKNDTETRNEPN